jgi:hypothetical protein
MVYFLRSRDKVKIGFTRDWAKRLRALRTANPTLHDAIVVEGERAHERALHYYLQAQRVNGEWFYGTESVNRVIRTARMCGVSAAVAEARSYFERQRYGDGRVSRPHYVEGNT